MALYNGSEKFSSQIGIAQYADVTDLMKHMTIEVGDVGQVMLPLNENENKRRYLNGQAILQEQFPKFTTKLKNAVSLYPSIACTESEWQSIRRADPDDQCAKFVIDDVAGTIRLPRIKYLVGNLNLYTMGKGLPTNRKLVKAYRSGVNWYNYYSDGWLEQGGRGQTNNSNVTINLHLPYEDTNYSVCAGCNTNGTYASPTACNILNTSQIQLRCAANTQWLWQTNGYAPKPSIDSQDHTTINEFESPYYIQVSTGVDYEVDVTNHITTNSPYSLGMYTHSIGRLNNLSWLKSDGTYHSGATYPDMYNWILQNYSGARNDGIEVGLKDVCYKWHQSDNTDFKIWTPNRNPQVGDAVYGYLIKHPAGYVTSVTDENTIVFLNSRTQTSITLVYESEDSNNFSLTDYMYALDTANQTFRLPLLTGDEMVPDWANLINPGFPTLRNNHNYRYIAPTNGFIHVGASRGNATGGTPLMYVNDTLCYQRPAWNSDVSNFFATVKRGDQIRFYCDTDNVYGIMYQEFVPVMNASPLYFYVGETVQDADLVNVGRIVENIANIDALAAVGAQVSELAPQLDTMLDNIGDLMAGNYNVPDYANGYGVGLPFTAPSNGWVFIVVDGYDSMHYATVNGKKVGASCGYSGGKAVRNGVMFMVAEGDVVSNANVTEAMFYPIKGASE